MNRGLRSIHPKIELLTRISGEVSVHIKTYDRKMAPLGAASECLGRHGLSDCDQSE